MFTNEDVERLARMLTELRHIVRRIPGDSEQSEEKCAEICNWVKYKFDNAPVAAVEAPRPPVYLPPEEYLEHIKDCNARFNELEQRHEVPKPAPPEVVIASLLGRMEFLEGSITALNNSIAATLRSEILKEKK